MHVRVEESREDMQPFRVEHDIALQSFAESDDAAILDADVHADTAGLGHHGAAPHDVHTSPRSEATSTGTSLSTKASSSRTSR